MKAYCKTCDEMGGKTSVEFEPKQIKWSEEGSKSVYFVNGKPVESMRDHHWECGGVGNGMDHINFK